MSVIEERTSIHEEVEQNPPARPGRVRSSSLKLGVRDLREGFGLQGLALWLANEDMRARYARTALGPWWNVIGSAVLIGAMGLTFGVIFRQPLAEFLPYVAAGLTIWNCLTTLTTDAPTVFSRNFGLISAYSLPLTIHVFRQVFDKLLMLGYALSIFAVVCVIFQRAPTIDLALFPLAVIIYFLFGVGIALLLGVWGTRYRDLSPALGSLMTLLFLLTPILWNKAAIGGYDWLVNYNPFFHLLEIGRGPLMGYAPTLTNWLASISVALGLVVFGALNFIYGRRDVLYWM